ncbi:MAG TPA: ABC transporter permease [Ramlibacter sp.]|nr:ABC transporter permease [Ramlibacter sp.]
MLNAIARRLGLALFTLVFVSFVTFVFLRGTGDPVDSYLDVNRTPEQVAALTTKLHLDQPLVVQYFIYLRDVLSGDFGDSIQYGGPALDALSGALGPSSRLIAAAMFITLVAGLVGGLVTAVWRDRWPDTLITSIAGIGQSMPSFWLGIVLIQIFALELRWLPTSGSGDFRHLVLPALTLSAVLVPGFLLVTRTAVIEILSEQFITTARAKGLSSMRTLLTHVLPNALGPMISYVGIQIGALLAGSILTETIFGWPGIGRLMIKGVFTRDVPVVIAAVMLVSVIIIVVNLVIDLLQTVIDPRIES